MSEKRRGLGRGLGALIPTGPEGLTERPSDVFFSRDQPAIHGSIAGSGTESASPEPDNSEPDADSTLPTGSLTDSAERNAPSQLKPVPGAEFADLPVAQIRPNPRQPRTVFDEDELAELAHSVREIGVLQPVVVRRLESVDETDGTSYELIMGERRLRATKAAGNATIPAIIRGTADEDLLRDALLENLHRTQLNPLEEAAAYQQLLEDFGCTQDDLAARIGRSRPQISNMIRLLKLPPLVQRRVAAGVLSAGHARALLGLPDAAAMERMAQRIVAEGLSVRTTEEIVALGGDEPRRERSASTRRSDPEFDDVAARIADRLDTRVNIAMGKSKGKITVEFAGTDDLQRILATLGLQS